MTLPPRRENADSVSRKRAVQAGSPVRKRLVPMPMTGSLTPVDGTAFVSRSRAACADTESGTIVVVATARPALSIFLREMFTSSALRVWRRGLLLGWFIASSEIEWMTMPESSIGNRTYARACVVGHVLGSAGTGNGTGHCGVAENELEQQLSPTRDADLAGPRR